MMDKEKVKAQLNEASTKAKAAWSEIKTNFKADEGTTGFQKIKSMFVNLWKSGTVGKSVLIAGVVILLLLPWIFGTNKASKYMRLERELEEIAIQICELDDLLGKEKSMENLGAWVLGRSLKDEKAYEKDMKEIRKASSKELDFALEAREKTLKKFKDDLKERKTKCKDKGIEIDKVSPLRVAKKFLLCLRAKDVEGMKKLVYGYGNPDTTKDRFVKAILDMVEEASDGSVRKLDQLEEVGRTFFNGERNKAGVAVEDEFNAGELVTGNKNYTCLRLIKTHDDGWLIDGGLMFDTLFCKSAQITNPILSAIGD